MSVHFEWYIALAGLIVGFAVGMTGMGGGALMTPILVLLFKVQPLAAVSSDLVASLIMKPLGAGVHATSRTVQWRVVRWLCLGSIPSAFLGVVFLRSFGSGRTVQNVVSLALGSVVLMAVAAVIVKTLVDRRQHPSETDGEFASVEVRRGPTLIIGAVTGFIVGITSVGSGTLVIVALLFLYPRLRGSQMVGTDLSQAIPMVASAAVAHILYGDFQLALTLSIVAGSIPGVLIGSVISSHTSSGVVRSALTVVLVASGLKLVNVPTPAVGAALGVCVLVVASTGLHTWAARRRVRQPAVVLTA
jgi:uncharacterized membrane protein YfcA